MVPLAPKLKVITYHFIISYRRKSVVNLVEIQNTNEGTKVPSSYELVVFWISTRLQTFVPSYLRGTNKGVANRQVHAATNSAVSAESEKSNRHST